MSGALGLVRALWGDETGQDLVEYALLTAFIGLAGAAVFGVLANSLGFAYGQWNVDVQDLWEPLPPVAP